MAQNSEHCTQSSALSNVEVELSLPKHSRESGLVPFNGRTERIRVLLVTSLL